MSVLKIVPERPSGGRGDDQRRKFFTENANSEKYYYMAVGDVPQAVNRNTLVPLGTFLGFLNYNRFGIPITDNQYSNQGAHSTYSMRFSNAPYNSECGAIFMNEVKPIVYTDEPPAPKSTPLRYYDYIQLTTQNGLMKEENTRMEQQIAQMPTAPGGKSVKLLEKSPGRRSKQADELRKQAHKYLSELPFSV